MNRVGVVGLGTIAPYFLDAITAGDRWTLGAVCDLNPRRLLSAPAAAFASASQLYASGAVDAVVITLPNDVHGSAVAEALDHGLHVCCEKPLTIDSATAYKLAETAYGKDLVLLTASHRRYNRNLATLALDMDGVPVRRVVSRYFERIEEHTGDEAWYLDIARCGGGCVIDNGPNAIDAVRVLVGEVDVVGCRLGDVRDAVEFQARIDLKARSGADVVVELDWTYPGQVKDVTVELADGRVLRADLLAGFDGLKGSLPHEYAAIMDRFADLVEAPVRVRDDGPRIAELVENAYALGRAE